jgi:hypothetical protein
MEHRIAATPSASPGVLPGTLGFRATGQIERKDYDG